jgi:ribosomal protein L16/L10AE
MGVGKICIYKDEISGVTSSVRPGQIIIEISGISLILGKDVLLKASRKLPIRTKIFFR